MSMPGIEVRRLRYAYGREEVLRGVDIDVTRGEIVALIGPNASGKSTLLKCVTGILRPLRGRVTVAGVPAGTRGRRAARLLSYVPQSTEVAYPLTVIDSVLLGLGRASWRVDRRDLQRAEAVLEHLGLAGLAQRPLPELSGGQRQKAAIARALVRDTPFLLLDEPTNHLDMKHKRDAISILNHSARVRQQGVLVVLHDINLAVQLADRVVLLSDGAVAACGQPGEVVTRERIRTVYGVEPKLVTHEGAQFVVGYER